MKLKLSLLLLLFSGLVYSQDDAYENTRLSIKIMPLGLIDVFNSPVYEGGVEFRIYHKLSMDIEGAGYFRGWMSTQANVRGYIAKVEPKLYLGDFLKFYGGDGSDDMYVSLECLYRKQNYDWTDSILLNPAYQKTFREFKTIYSFTLKYGQCYTFGSGFMFEWYLGLGIRVKTITSSLTDLEASKMDMVPPGDGQDPSDEWALTYGVGHYWWPNIELGVKIGYCLWR
ncbi:MAG TPA: hypothetical protein VK890_13165 [Bacteroidia bacterium]|jgi:hypothetical protein|nr:hypothetical protein [Bacteroidia bacterium]